MSRNYSKVKEYYEKGLWDIGKVWNVVGRPLGITEQEYKQITGLVYPERG